MFQGGEDASQATCDRFNSDCLHFRTRENFLSKFAGLQLKGQYNRFRERFVLTWGRSRPCRNAGYNGV